MSISNRKWRNRMGRKYYGCRQNPTSRARLAAGTAELLRFVAPETLPIKFGVSCFLQRCSVALTRPNHSAIIPRTKLWPYLMYRRKPSSIGNVRMCPPAQVFKRLGRSFLGGSYSLRILGRILGTREETLPLLQSSVLCLCQEGHEPYPIFGVEMFL